MKKIVLVLMLASGVACGIPKSQYDALEAKEQKEKTDSDKEIADLKTKIAELEGKSGQLDEQTKKELDELRAQKSAAESRAKLFDDFVNKFKSMIDAGKLDITTRRGQIVLALATDVLFDEGKTDIKAEGKTAIGEVAAALESRRRPALPGRGSHGHVPDPQQGVPLELGAVDGARRGGREAPRRKRREGRPAERRRLRGVRRGAEQQATDKGRQKNRRIEIVLVPNIEELVKMPELKPIERTPPPPSATTTTPPPKPTTTAKPPPPKKK